MAGVPRDGVDARHVSRVASALVVAPSVHRSVECRYIASLALCKGPNPPPPALEVAEAAQVGRMRRVIVVCAVTTLAVYAAEQPAAAARR